MNPMFRLLMGTYILPSGVPNGALAVGSDHLLIGGDILVIG